MNNKVLTYSLLAHIRNKNELITGPVDIFIPLVKKALAYINNSEKFAGEHISEICEACTFLYGIDIPVTVMAKILKAIANDINTEDVTYFQLNNDGSFALYNYSFTQYDATIEILKTNLSSVNELFKGFCEGIIKAGEGIESIYNFIENSKHSLGQYLGSNKKLDQSDNTVVAEFIKFFQPYPKVYETIRQIYLGSVIASYLEYETGELRTDLELVLDTNFIIAILGLDSKESINTCSKIIEIAQRQKFKLTALADTIEETRILLQTKAHYFDKSFLVKKINPEDIYNACERLNYTRTDLERVADNIENKLGSIGVSFVYQTDKYRNVAKNSSTYRHLLPYRNNNKKAALHDATVIEYVKKARGKKITHFEKVNCWFLNNAFARLRYEESVETIKLNGQPITIKADDLLNILWLSNPQISANLNFEQLGDIGLNSLLSLSLNKSLPSAKSISELESNIVKYGKEELSDRDILLLANRISTKQLNNIEGLNNLAKTDQEKFVLKLEAEAKKQEIVEEKQKKKLETLISGLIMQEKRLDSLTGSLEDSVKVKDEFKKEVGQIKKELESATLEVASYKEKIKSKYIDKEYKKWKWKPLYFLLYYLLFLLLMVFVVYGVNYQNWSATFTAIDAFRSNVLGGIIFWGGTIAVFGYCLTLLSQRWHNISQIKTYKDNLEIPDEIYD